MCFYSIECYQKQYILKIVILQVLQNLHNKFQ